MSLSIRARANNPRADDPVTPSCDDFPGPAVTVRERRIWPLIVIVSILVALAGTVTWLVTVRGAASGRPSESAPPASGVSAVSTGEATTVRLGRITVTAAAGSIANGQTLTITPVDVARQPRVASVSGGAFQLASSQGQPTGPVSMNFTFDPAAFPRPHHHPALIHQEQPDLPWGLEMSTLTASGDSVNATVTHFSPFDWVDTFDYAFGLVTNNRTDAVVNGCGPTPDWMETVVLPMPVNDLNAAVWACPDASTAGDTLYLHIVNNRGYGQLLNFSGVPVDSAASQWGPTSLEQAFGQGVAASANTATHQFDKGTTNLAFVAGGSSVTVAMHRPATGSTPITVDVSATPIGAAVAADLIWTAIQQLSSKVKVGTDLINCAFTGIQFATSRVDDPMIAYDLMDKCIGTIIGVTEAWAPIDTILTVDGLAQTLNDTFVADKYPAHLVFTLKPAANAPPSRSPITTSPSLPLPSTRNGAAAGTMTVDVPATAPSVKTAVLVDKGQNVAITASGHTTYGPETRQGCVGTPTVMPDGSRSLPSGSCPPQLDAACEAPDFPVAALIARIGTDPWFLIGSAATFTAATSGEIILGYNDRYWNDNVGSYQATIVTSS